jgi:ligand-binding sensor domain-containing protein
MTNSRIRISTLITLLVLSLLTPIKSKSETTGSDFINITYLNGLTTNSIYDICTDKSGCLWIGTATGLSKYNGYNVQNFFKEEMYIRSNIIKYLMCDKRNRIWIGSGSGVGLYDNDTEKFLNLDLMTGDAVENKVAGLFEDFRGTIWVSLRSGAITAINPDTFSTSKHL